VGLLPGGALRGHAELHRGRDLLVERRLALVDGLLQRADLRRDLGDPLVLAEDGLERIGGGDELGLELLDAVEELLRLLVLVEDGLLARVRRVPEGKQLALGGVAPLAELGHPEDVLLLRRRKRLEAVARTSGRGARGKRGRGRRRGGSRLFRGRGRGGGRGRGRRLLRTRGGEGKGRERGGEEHRDSFHVRTAKGCDGFRKGFVRVSKDQGRTMR
jgi:hypothetical protein